ncbi:MAG TPA: hypothetical protein VMN78_12240 [Longimicrobiales bacterium]|nr:hypothetical protein [Longimicrobiales bacterium]
MGILGPSREPRGPDPHLDVKIFLFLAGAALAVAGMATGISLLVWLAFVPLAIAFVVRFFLPKP